jgi:molybdopterin converting factor small subunit
MKAITEVHLFGSLRNGERKLGSQPVQYGLEAPMVLKELLDRLEIAPDRVQLAMVNHRAVFLDHLIHPGDRIALFPREYTIFADWKNFRP